MFVLPAIIVPFIFLRALYRLYQIPADLMAGRLRMPDDRRGLWTAASALAYLLLLGSTVAMGVAVVYALFFAADRLAALLELTAFGLVYPLLYMASAWIFYYSLKPGPASDAPPRS